MKTKLLLLAILLVLLSTSVSSQIKCAPVEVQKRLNELTQTIKLPEGLPETGRKTVEQYAKILGDKFLAEQAAEFGPQSLLWKDIREIPVRGRTQTIADNLKLSAETGKVTPEAIRERNKEFEVNQEKVQKIVDKFNKIDMLKLSPEIRDLAIKAYEEAIRKPTFQIDKVDVGLPGKIFYEPAGIASGDFVSASPLKTFTEHLPDGTEITKTRQVIHLGDGKGHGAEASPLSNAVKAALEEVKGSSLEEQMQKTADAAEQLIPVGDFVAHSSVEITTRSDLPQGYKQIRIAGGNPLMIIRPDGSVVDVSAQGLKPAIGIKMPEVIKQKIQRAQEPSVRSVKEKDMTSIERSLLEVTDENGVPKNYLTDPQGNLIKSKDAEGNEIIFIKGLPTKEIDPELFAIKDKEGLPKYYVTDKTGMPYRDAEGNAYIKGVIEDNSVLLMRTDGIEEMILDREAKNGELVPTQGKLAGLVKDVLTEMPVSRTGQIMIDEGKLHDAILQRADESLKTQMEKAAEQIRQMPAEEIQKMYDENNLKGNDRTPEKLMEIFKEEHLTDDFSLITLKVTDPKAGFEAELPTGLPTKGDKAINSLITEGMHPATAAKLRDMGFETIADITARYPDSIERGKFIQQVTDKATQHLRTEWKNKMDLGSQALAENTLKTIFGEPQSGRPVTEGLQRTGYDDLSNLQKKHSIGIPIDTSKIEPVKSTEGETFIAKLDSLMKPDLVKQFGEETANKILKDGVMVRKLLQPDKGYVESAMAVELGERLKGMPGNEMMTKLVGIQFDPATKQPMPVYESVNPERPGMSMADVLLETRKALRTGDIEGLKQKTGEISEEAINSYVKFLENAADRGVVLDLTANKLLITEDGNIKIINPENTAIKETSPQYMRKAIETINEATMQAQNWKQQLREAGVMIETPSNWELANKVEVTCK